MGTKTVCVSRLGANGSGPWQTTARATRATAALRAA
jgi:hypothetical protein